VLPRLFSIGPFTVYSYGVLLAIGFVLGLRYATVRARQHGLDAARILDLGVLVLVAAILGAKLLLLIVDLPTVLRQPGQILSMLRAGGVFYGGLIAAVAVGIWYIRRQRMPLWTTCDVFAPPIALGHVVGRLGCLAAGCCFGRPTSLPWGITFHDHFASGYVGTPLDVAVHPTQLYEAGAEALILVALLLTERREAIQELRPTHDQSRPGTRVTRSSSFARPFPGRTFWLFLALYAVSRFVIEFFRGDERGVLFGVSTSQFISLVILPLSFLMLALLARRQAPTPAPKHGPAAPAHR
jgi:phosphatidylglycerol---prolipoprotein diacylglyceryl transferase